MYLEISEVHLQYKESGGTGGEEYQNFSIVIVCLFPRTSPPKRYARPVPIGLELDVISRAVDPHP